MALEASDIPMLRIQAIIRPANRIGRFCLQVVLGSLAVALITYFAFGTKRLIIPAFLFLLVVVLQSIWGEFGPAAVVSVIATTCLDYFFIPPVLEWQIDDSEDALVLAVCLATSLIITRLATKSRNQARQAERKRQDASRLYEAASRLLALDPDSMAGPEFPRVFRDVFSLTAVCLFDASTGTLQVDGHSGHELEAKTRQACLRGASFQDDNAGIYVRCLRAGNRVTGAAGFEGRICDDSIALSLSALAATAIERIRLFRDASNAAADAQAEMLRSAILDAFAHEFKTPLAIILAASGGLRESEGTALECRRMEMTDIIETQTIRLSQLTTRLLRVARLDREHVSPQMEPVNLTDLLRRSVSQYRQHFGRRISLEIGNETAKALADNELMGLAITQLLDNACKYSFPGTPIGVELTTDGKSVHIRVTNQGAGVSAEEQTKIFERFFRGSETETIAAGAGLGLFVARKIVLAHDGTLELDLSRSSSHSTTFHIAVPVIQYERQQEHEHHQSLSR